VVKGGRMIKLVECLRNSDDNDSEVNIKHALDIYSYPSEHLISY
jgi:hypothetical protein